MAKSGMRSLSLADLKKELLRRKRGSDQRAKVLKSRRAALQKKLDANRLGAFGPRRRRVSPQACSKRYQPR